MGIGGPVGSGKTALINALCKKMRNHYQIAVVTNDIYTKEDAQFLIRNEALEEERIVFPEHRCCLSGSANTSAATIWAPGLTSGF